MKGRQDMEARAGRLHTGDAARRIGGLVAVVALSVGALVASSLASAPPASAKSASVKALTIKTVHVANVGTVLATSSGRTLYRFTVDPAGKATCTGACAKVWPPLLLPKGVSHIKVPHGVKGLSLVRVAGGRLQVFFHHQALYGFVSDTKKGMAAGQNVEHAWFAVLASGKSSVPAPTSVPAPPVTPGTTKSSSTPSTSKTSGTTAPTSPATSPPATTPPTTKTTTPTTTMTTTPPTTKTPPPPASPPPPPTTTTTAPPTGGAGF
jgi:predicted lipoprotein with Yx(FWY)xxD motif